MVEVLQSAEFKGWFQGLKDGEARARINARIRRLSLGNAGDAKAVSTHVTEIRIHHGPGYRVYFTRVAEMVVVLLCGGDKHTQKKDIATAVRLAKEWRAK